MNPAPKLNVRPLLIAWCIFLLIMELIAVRIERGGISERLDFRCFYAAGYLVRTHPSQLYELAQQELTQDSLAPPTKGVLVFYRPSYEALLYSPFSLLGYRAAYLAFIAFNLFLLLAVLFVVQPLLSPDRAWLKSLPWLKSRPWLMFFLFIPLLLAVVHCQDSILFLLLSSLAWRNIESGKDFRAGCFLALALFKFQIAIPMAILVAVRRGWRFTTGFVVTSAGLVLLCIGIVGRAETLSMFRLVFSAVSASGQATSMQRIMTIYPSAMPNMEGLLYVCGARFLPPSVFIVVVGLCSFCLFLWCISTVRRLEQNVAFSVAILCSLLVSHHLYVHDLTVSLLPAALLPGRAQRYFVPLLFGLPTLFFFLPFGLNSSFLLAIPILAMLIYTLMFPSSLVSSPSPMTQATPA